MKFSKILPFAILGSFFCKDVYAKIEIGSKLPPVKLERSLGGKIDGTPWNSNELDGKIWVLFYVDPDKKDENLEFEKALKNANFDATKIKSVGIINFAASWIPDSILNSALKAKQKEYPSTIYVKDQAKVLVEQWGLQDDAYNTIILNPQGEVLFFKDGPISLKETTEIVSIIRKNISLINS